MVALCAVLVLILALLWVMRSPRRVRAGEPSARAAAQVAGRGKPLSLVFQVDKELVVTGERTDRPVELRDQYFARIQIEPGTARATFVASGGQRCDSAKVAERSSSELLREVLVATDAGLRLERLKDVDAPLIAMPGTAPAVLSLISTGTAPVRHAWPLLDEVGTSTDEERAVKLRVFDATKTEWRRVPPDPRIGRFTEKWVEDPLPVDAVQRDLMAADAEPRVLFNPLAEEPLTIEPDGEAKLEVPGGRDVSCYRMRYFGEARAWNLHHKIDGTVWVARGIGPIQEDRRVTVEIKSSRADGRSSDPKARREVVQVIKTRTTRKLAIRPEAL